jgi:hypothetical protein
VQSDKWRLLSAINDDRGAEQRHHPRRASRCAAAVAVVAIVVLVLLAAVATVEVRTG